jgi:uncharacterized protein (TIGR02588 family)
MAKTAKKTPIPALEWVSAALGLAIAVALLGILGREALTGESGELPRLATRMERIEAMPGGYVVEVIVTNQAGRTAARVELEGMAGGEVSRATIDYVPGHSQAEGGLLFRTDPRRGGLTVRVTGYQLP